MKRKLAAAICILCASIFGGYAAAQEPVAPENPAGSPAPMAVAPPVYSGPVVLEWVPPALSYLSTEASMKESFTFDRTMLEAAGALLPDSDAPAREAINRLDGVSVHLLRFPQDGIISEDAVDTIRDAYHLRGWKHLVTTTERGGPVHDQTTDVWVVMDGINIRGAVVMAETPKSLTLVTVAGNINPIDLLHLRGHFGIPDFNGDRLRDIDHHRHDRRYDRN